MTQKEFTESLDEALSWIRSIQKRLKATDNTQGPRHALEARLRETEVRPLTRHVHLTNARRCRTQHLNSKTMTLMVMLACSVDHFRSWDMLVPSSHVLLRMMTGAGLGQVC